MGLATRIALLGLALLGSNALPWSGPAQAEEKIVALPDIVDRQVSIRVLYVENPRFPKVSQAELRFVMDRAAKLVDEHFGIRVDLPETIPTISIDGLFTRLVAEKPDFLDGLIGDFRHGAVDWAAVRDSLVEQIGKQTDPLDKQIAFARPHLIRPPVEDSLDAFADAVIDTFKARLAHWTSATLEDGHPVVGAVPGRPDLPLNEYGYWSLMARQGVPAEVVLTNQLVASVEYMSIPVHTSIRGGITGGSTEYNPQSRLGASVWVTLFPYLSEDQLIRELRNGDSYGREAALSYAGAMVAHEMGHQLLQLGHPWANEACVMRPAEVLDFAAWVARFDAPRCKIGSSAAMTPGVDKAPIW
ncbi:hypothetical protein JCM17960_31840 [Magnetospira thiophila]